MFRRRMRPDDRARQLLRVAEQTFAADGFHATTMEEIARRAGVSRTVLYRHYPSKDALAAASLRESRVLLTAAAQRAASVAPDPEQALRATLCELLSFIRDHAQLYSVFLADGALRGTRAHVEAEATREDIEHHLERLLAGIAPGLLPGVLTLCVRAFVGAADRVALPLAGDSDPQQTADTLVDFMLHGLTALQPPP